jgi:hypothetical protein
MISIRQGSPAGTAGAGKSTILPLALLGSDWLAGRTRLMLEKGGVATVL